MATIRVHEISKELGVPSKQILQWLKTQGEFVKSASSTIEPAVVRRLMRGFQAGNALTGEPSLTSVPDTARSDAAALLGIDGRLVKLRKQPRQHRRHAARPKPIDKWAQNLIAPEDKAAWIAAGLGPDDARIAHQCLMAGLAPADLSLRLDGVRACLRLRGGESVVSVKIRVQEYKAKFKSA